MIPRKKDVTALHDVIVLIVALIITIMDLIFSNQLSQLGRIHSFITIIPILMILFWYFTSRDFKHLKRNKQ